MIGFESLRYGNPVLLLALTFSAHMSPNRWIGSVPGPAEGVKGIARRLDPANHILVPLGVSSLGAMIQPRQDYYWSPAWQEAEREALEEHRRGESVSFDRAEDAIRWLMED